MVYLVILLQIINLNPNLDFTIARHDTGNIILQVTDRAHIGGETTGTTNIPYGLRYPRTGSDHLFFGGFCLTNSITYVADGHYAPNQRIDRDFRIVDVIHRVFRYGLQEFEAAYIDSGHPTPKSLKVTQYSLASPNPNYDDGVIMIFTIKNLGNTRVESLYAGIILDLDLPGGSPSELSGTDTVRRCVYQRGSTTENPTVGIKILWPRSWANLACLYNPTYVHPYYGLPDSFKYKFLKGIIRQYAGVTASDWSSVASIGPFSLEPNEEYQCAFALLGGSSVNEFLNNADSLQAFYERLVGINENRNEKKVTLLTNPVIINNKTKLLLKTHTDEELKVNLYDLCGKYVDCLGKIKGEKVHSLKIDKSYSQGIYFLRVEGKKVYLTKKVVYLK